MYACILNSTAISFSTENIYGDCAIDLGDDFMIPGDKQPVYEDGELKWIPIPIEPEYKNELMQMMEDVVNMV